MICTPIIEYPWLDLVLQLCNPIQN